MAQRSSSAKTEGASTFTELLDQNQPFKNFDPAKNDQSKVELNDDRLQRVQGSLIGLAVGDALGASVEFRPHDYLKENRVTDMLSGGTWGLQKGQWTDDTSMALCLAASLIVKRGFDAYDQFQRYCRWFKEGYLSSTGKCFDIGKSTREAIMEFEKLKQESEKKVQKDKIDKNHPQYEDRIKFELNKRRPGLQLGLTSAAGNGALMRLAPLPCFFCDSYDELQNHIDNATRLTHGDPIAVDACKFYAGLIFYALNGTSKEQLLNENFYKDRLKLTLRYEIKEIAEGSYKKKRKGYDDGIRGKGYIVNSLEAALWAFYTDGNNFETGVLEAVNLGDDTDTTAAIYGELAGAVYGIHKIPQRWTEQLFQYEFIKAVANNLYATRKPLKSGQQRSDWENDSTKDYGGGTYQGRQDGRASARNEANSNQSTNHGDTNNNPNPNTKAGASTGSSAEREKASGSTESTRFNANNAANNNPPNDSPSKDTKSSEKRQKHGNNTSSAQDNVDSPTTPIEIRQNKIMTEH